MLPKTGIVAVIFKLRKKPFLANLKNSNTVSVRFTLHFISSGIVLLLCSLQIRHTSKSQFYSYEFMMQKQNYW